MATLTHSCNQCFNEILYHSCPVTIKYSLYFKFGINFYFLNAEKGLDHIAENILSYLDDSSLRNAELVCKEWRRVIADGMLWKKLIERKVGSLYRLNFERRVNIVLK